MRITLDLQSYHFEDEVAEPSTLLQICGTCNIPDSHLVKRFLHEQSFLFHTWYTQDRTKLVLTYSAPLQLRKFFFDPGRSQHLYSVPLIIGTCREAIECATTKSWQPNLKNYIFIFKVASGLCHFFTPNKDCQFSRASLM